MGIFRAIGIDNQPYRWNHGTNQFAPAQQLVNETCAQISVSSTDEIHVITASNKLFRYSRGSWLQVEGAEVTSGGSAGEHYWVTLPSDVINTGVIAGADAALSRAEAAGSNTASRPHALSPIAVASIVLVCVGVAIALLV
jgi:hypothetical protein